MRSMLRANRLLGKGIFLMVSIMVTSVFADKNAATTAIIISDLRCESLVTPLGVDIAKPRLSWRLSSDKRMQKQNAYHILVASSMEKLNADKGDVWDSGKIVSGQSTQIQFAGSRLVSDRTYFWKVKIWDQENNASQWSDPSYWSSGLFDDSDWQAKWIGLDKAVGDDDPDSEHRRLSARMLRHEFSVTKKIKRATAFISGLGLFELYVNGEKIGDQVLAPGLTEYDKRTFYMTFDISEQLKMDQNALGVILGNGRYFAPRFTEPTKTRTYGFPKLRLQVHVEYEDGSRDVIGTDEKWKLTTEGPILANNEYDGEVYDARKELPGWNRAGYDDSAWRSAEEVDKPGEKLVSQMNEPIQVMRTIQPVTVSVPEPGMYIFDMGQNMVGWVKLNISAAPGTRVTLRFAEVLKADGTLYLDNIRGAEVTDVYILKGNGTESWEPKFTYHGFRYVEVSGLPEKPALSLLEGKVVYDGVETVGSFQTSNALINQIYKNAVWGIEGNYRSIPTDCPQRDERQGWLGDRSVESKGESYIFDISKLYSKWLTDIQDAQRESGSIADVAPSYWPFYNDNTTWPGSYIIIANMLYNQYHDLQTIRRHYPSMKKWIDHMSQYVKDDIMTRDTYGDWCVPPEELHLIHSNDPNRTTSGELIGTAYFHHELKLMTRFAELLGKADEAAVFRNRAAAMKTAFNTKFLSTDPVLYANNSQTASILALTFELVPENYRQQIFENLVVKIMGEGDGHVGTGLVGGQWLMRVLSDNGRPDIAYRLASNETYPSWGYMVQQGATTIWELWNGDKGDPGMNSHNHVMLLGDLITWFYEDLGGIQSDPDNPAFSHIIMRPEIVGDLRFVSASHRSTHGMIRSAWKNENGKFQWEISVPVNCTATVFIPAEDINQVTEAGQAAGSSPGVTYLRQENGRQVYQVESGTYSFAAPLVKPKFPQPFVATPEISPQTLTHMIPDEITVGIDCATSGAVIRYTLDGSEPGSESPVYSDPFTINKSTWIRAAAFKETHHASIAVSRYFDFIDPEKNGVSWKLYAGAFRKLPDFNEIKPVKEGSAFQMNLKEVPVPEANFALRFDGWVQIDQTGNYTFSTNSNDGSRLYLDGQLVVDSDGEHGPKEVSGDIKLSPGRYPLQVDYFQSGGSKTLNVFIKGPGLVRQAIPASRLYRDDK